MALIDIKKVQDDAQAEYAQERMKDAKEKVKEKLKLIEKAKLVVRNLERELEDLYATLGQ
jgi:hypothetical protein